MNIKNHYQKDWTKKKRHNRSYGKILEVMISRKELLFLKGNGKPSRNLHLFI